MNSPRHSFVYHLYWFYFIYTLLHRASRPAFFPLRKLMSRLISASIVLISFIRFNNPWVSICFLVHQPSSLHHIGFLFYSFFVFTLRTLFIRPSRSPPQLPTHTSNPTLPFCAPVPWSSVCFLTCTVSLDRLQRRSCFTIFDVWIMNLQSFKRVGEGQ